MRHGMRIFLTILGIGAFVAVGTLLSMEDVSTQTREILVRTALLLVFSCAGIVLIAFFYLYIDRRARRIIENHANFITHLYNSIPEGICQLSIRPPFRVLRINPEGLKIFGFGEDQAHENKAGLLLDDIISPKDQEEMAQILRDACSTGRRYAYTHRLKARGDACRWVSGVVEKALDEDGNQVLITTFHDVTGEKLRQHELEKERSFERNLLISAISNIYPLIASCNPDDDSYHVLYQSGTSLLTRRQETTYSEVVRRIGESVHPEDRERFYGRFGWDALKNGASRDGAYMEGKFLLTDGEYHWVSLEMIPVYWEAMTDRVYIIMVRPIDEQRNDEEMRFKVMEAALNSANAASSAKSEFLSRMSHDIRTPMNAIVGMTEIANHYIEDPDHVKYCLSKISASSAHLLSLINDVLDMSKIESGKMTLNVQPFDLQEEVLNMNLMLQGDIETKNLKMKTRFEGFAHKEVMGDALRFRQIYLNIVGNAIKFTPPGGQIVIELTELQKGQKDYGYYQFVFSDNGIGMDKEFMKRIFEPFERAGNGDRTEGTGLGMSITKNLVDLMKGSIHVESEPGKGAAFTVLLHFRLQSGEQKEDAGFTREKSALSDNGSTLEDTYEDFQGRRILLAEDNELNREIARELISMTGAVVDEAGDGLEAVRMMEESPEGFYSMVITDIQMPGMDGYEEARTIRSMPRKDAGTIPIIAMTANAFSDDVKRAREAGMNGYIAKPVDTKALYEMMRRWLERV